MEFLERVQYTRTHEVPTKWGGYETGHVKPPGATVRDSIRSKSSEESDARAGDNTVARQKRTQWRKN